ncbi:MAG: hypothetical protein Kow0099_22830 [Candidatus Abyssubacteria bacterium]
MIRKSLGLLLTVVVLSFSSLTTAATYYVPDDFATIQAALNDATDNDTVIVRDGTYSGASNKNLDFKGKSIYLRSENGPANCIIDCQGEGRGFYFHTGESYDSVVDGFTITNALVYHTGVFPDGWGAGILCFISSPTIRNCVITGNQSIGTESGSGAGISCYQVASPDIVNCVIAGNSGVWGGGIYCNFWSSPTISNCTIVGNSVSGGGGAIYTANESWPLITDSIMWSNSAPFGPEIDVVQNSDLSVAYSDVSGGAAAAYVAADSALHWDIGNLNTNPLFVSGPLGAYYLSQTTAGQLSTSACVDAGSDTAARLTLDTLTTRTDHVSDTGTVDMGFHYGWDPTLKQINLISPFKSSTLSHPPTFYWTALGGADNAFAVEASLSPTFGKYWSTYSDLHQVIQTKSWAMPLVIWNLIPSGTRVYWRVRGADLAEEPLRIVNSGQIWSFIKQ